MDIVINYKIDTPIYQQVYDQISSQILSRKIPPKYLLPSIRAVSKELGVSVITIKKAWEMLESNGFIFTVVGKGTFTNYTTKSALERKKLDIAREKMVKDLEYYKSLGLSRQEILDLVKSEY